VARRKDGFFLQPFQHTAQWDRIQIRFRSLALVRATGGLLVCSDALEAAIRAHVGHIDEHTLEQLARMGHPYGYRTRADESGADRSPRPHGPFDVHIQFDVRRGGGITVSSQLIDAIFSEMKIRSGYAVVAKVGVDTTRAPHAIYVIDGTRYMIQRDFLRGSYEEMKPKFGALFSQGFSGTRI